MSQLVLRKGESTYHIKSLRLHCDAMSEEDYAQMVELANGNIKEYKGYTVEQYGPKYTNHGSVESMVESFKKAQAKLRKSQGLEPLV